MTGGVAVNEEERQMCLLALIPHSEFLPLGNLGQMLARLDDISTSLITYSGSLTVTVNSCDCSPR